MPTIFTVYIH